MTAAKGMLAVIQGPPARTAKAVATWRDELIVPTGTPVAIRIKTMLTTSGITTPRRALPSQNQRALVGAGAVFAAAR